ncbi:MAG TPA: acetyl-CoA carboxylase biotin carboxyl carrier protein [Lachnospiraceae bacterium]|nr:acetyl-CoA carboxylase biotin carboxyl carrier protein [Lachnospiraceae bacterium]
MEFNDIKELIGIIDSSNLRSFELSNNGAFIKMSKNTAETASTNAPVVVAETLSTQEKQVVVQKTEISEKPKAESLSGNVVKAPLVGTFYASSAPGKPNFVSVGSKVKKGDVLCIIEAMKIMNEVVSEFDGEVAQVLATPEALVEYGQPLFRIV